MDSSPIGLPALGCVCLDGSVISLLLYRFQKINLQPLTCGSPGAAGFRSAQLVLLRAAEFRWCFMEGLWCQVFKEGSKSTAGGQDLGMGSSWFSCQQDLTRFDRTELSTLVLGSPCRSCIGSQLSCSSYCQNKPLDLGTASAALESHESPCNAKSTIFTASLPVSQRPCPNNLFIRT